MTTLTPEYLASLRKVAEHMRDHGLVLQDMRAENTLALLDRIEALEAMVRTTDRYHAEALRNGGDR